MTEIGGQGDFASAAMMRLVAAGLARQGISVPLNRPAGAHVPRTEKRELLEEILVKHGPLAILQISDAAPHMPPEPLTQALTRALSMGELLDRWQRMERFSHGRHMVHYEPVADDAFYLTHQARDGGAPPSPVESLLVLGLISVLAEMIGCANVVLSTEAGYVWRQAQSWHEPVTNDAPGRVKLSGRAMDQKVQPWDPGSPGDCRANIRGRITADPVRRWSLSELAADTGTSVRTLQRRLSENSMSFSRILAEARLEVAAGYLCDARGPSLAEIGFLAGYSDQAHFTRSFSRAVGTTPSIYRAEFHS